MKLNYILNRKRLNGGTVPPFQMHPGGTVRFYDIYFLSLILDYRAKQAGAELCQAQDSLG